MKSRRSILTFILIGLLNKKTMHGYELRKQLAYQFGPMKTLSFGVLYPQLRRMVDEGIIKEKSARHGGRSRIEYSVTTKGKNYFNKMASEIDEASWDDENFGAHFSFFSTLSKRNRIRVLEGRILKLEKKFNYLSKAWDRTSGKVDKYLAEWHKHSINSTHQEIEWLKQLLRTERK